MSAAFWIVIAGILIALLTFSAVAFVCDWPKPKLKYGNIKAGCSIKVHKNDNQSR